MKKHQLFDLLNGYIDPETGGESSPMLIRGIEIPIIQRDYAQGRVEETLILNRFLAALFDALAADCELELDFIYGSVKAGTQPNEGGMFLPLDGQQRLTTLYLLHWYLCNQELEPEEQVPVREKLSRFSYATRFTAASFCEKLAGINFAGNPADQIREAYWFHKLYEKDPTVTAMLHTLEAIHAKYKRQSFRLYDRLHHLCFYILPLDGFSLTDELYIKMNARGKQLTDFENLKADLVGHLKDDAHPDHKVFFGDAMYGETKMPYYLSIASRIDNSWTDIFWPSAKLKVKDEEKIVDPFFLRLLNRYALNRFIVSSTRPVNEIELNGIFRQLYGTQGNDANVRYRQFEPYHHMVSASAIAELEMFLNNLTLHQQEIRELVRPSWDQGDSWFLYDEKINQVQRILFLAVTLYLERNTFQAQRFGEWLRVCWNIMIDPDIRSIPAMITAMKTISRLAPGSGNIYDFLQTETCKLLISETNNIHKEQLQEESRKAALLSLPEWAGNIRIAEAHLLLQGNIGFLLAGDPDASQFALRVDNVQKIFNGTGPDRTFIPDHDLFRYVISKFSSWDHLLQFTFSDDYRNWQLSLRRNSTCKRAIRELCDMTTDTDIHLAITVALDLQSSFSNGPDKRMSKIHKSLYRYPDFTAWTQKSDRLIKLKWLHDHMYIIRPGAWYDKVMLDCWRNELIDYFSQLAGVRVDARCGGSAFFHGEEIEVELISNGLRYRVLFNRANQVLVKTRQEVDGLITWQTRKTFFGSRVQDDDAAAVMAGEIHEFITNVHLDDTMTNAGVEPLPGIKVDGV